ncbi:NAD(P)-dependent oxidoreductase [Sinanaerobacter chloroacetimidivorans]|jgi:putative NADH-flavin reductase|uniref:NAD(P)H-binding protein n=1 Tax=Sinanaerobacter chloroacetimidivorans TaxID=2818044 RepID=A0A8J8B1K8_9FIRM|nr:NAD(P)H-binding protein [Sinanaerobacter chloroacetimidivorans]MBR0597776.1 NAD(P)H-binding protein [Sinanaerobacter chloroacetimidivorans]
MKFVIVGVSGRIGSRAAKEAVSRGHQVIGIDAFAKGEIEGVEIHQCAIEEFDKMVGLMAGADAVLNAIAANMEHPERYGKSIQFIIDECKAARVPKLLSIIGSSSALCPNGTKLIESDYFEEANRIFYENICKSEEVYEHEKELNWGCITPAAFMELPEPILKKYRMGDDYLVIMDEPGIDKNSEAYFDISKISLTDFAYACVDELENDRIHQRRCCVGY